MTDIRNEREQLAFEAGIRWAVAWAAGQNFEELDPDNEDEVRAVAQEYVNAWRADQPARTGPCFGGWEHGPVRPDGTCPICKLPVQRR